MGIRCPSASGVNLRVPHAVTNVVLSSAAWIFWGSRLPAFWIASSSTRVASWACTAKLVGSVPVFFL
jgi:hypothetical protein